MSDYDPPVHAPEHEDMLRTCAKMVEASGTVEGLILITVGYDGRPCVGGNLGSAEDILVVLQQLVDYADLANPGRTIPLPRNN